VPVGEPLDFRALRDPQSGRHGIVTGTTRRGDRSRLTEAPISLLDGVRKTPPFMQTTNDLQNSLPMILAGISGVLGLLIGLLVNFFSFKQTRTRHRRLYALLYGAGLGVAASILTVVGFDALSPAASKVRVVVLITSGLIGGFLAGFVAVATVSVCRWLMKRGASSDEDLPVRVAEAPQPRNPEAKALPLRRN